MYVQLPSGTSYKIAAVGYQDYSDTALSFNVLVNNYSLDEIYAEFNDDTSSLVFTYDDGSAAWTKNNYSTLVDFKVVTNCVIGKDDVSGADEYADVVTITLTNDDSNIRITDLEDSVTKLVLSSVETATTLANLQNSIDNATVASNQITEIRKLLNDNNTMISEFTNDLTELSERVDTLEANGTTSDTNSDISVSISELTERIAALESKIINLESATSTSSTEV